MSHPRGMRACTTIAAQSAGEEDGGRATFLKYERREVQGVQTDLFVYRPKMASKMHVVLLPGNPGIAAYYDTLARALDAQIHASAPSAPQHRITAVSYASFTRARPGSNVRCEINEEARHKREVLEALTGEFGDDQFVVVGHSIGAWIALKMLKEKVGERVRAVVMIFPFLYVDQSSGFQKMLRAAINVGIAQGIVGVLARVLAAVPEKWRRVFGEWVTKDDHCEASRKVTMRYFFSGEESIHCWENVPALAGTEFTTLGRTIRGQPPAEIDCDTIRKNAEKIWAVYTDDDTWAPMYQLEMLKVRVPMLRAQRVVHFGEHVKHEHGRLMPHAFCTDERWSRAVIDGIAHVLEEILGIRQR